MKVIPLILISIFLTACGAKEITNQDLQGDRWETTLSDNTYYLTFGENTLQVTLAEEDISDSSAEANEESSSQNFLDSLASEADNLIRSIEQDIEDAFVLNAQYEMTDEQLFVTYRNFNLTFDVQFEENNLLLGYQGEPLEGLDLNSHITLTPVE